MTDAKKIKGHQGRSTRTLLSLIRKFHLLIFFVVVAIGLSAAVVLLNHALTETSSEQYIPNITSGSIDSATLERIKLLHTSDQPTEIQLPDGRTNPFSE